MEKKILFFHFICYYYNRGGFMNSNDNKDLFDMYGLEHEKVENDIKNDDNNITLGLNDNVPIEFLK